MAYDMPYGQGMHNQQCFFAGNGNMPNQPVFGQEHLMNIENAWMENIHPLLRQTQTQDGNLTCQQQPLQRFVSEPERAFFTANPLPTAARLQSFPRVSRPCEAIPSLPQATGARMVSPSPSGASQEPYSQCSSARSPAPEVDWFNENFFTQQSDDFFFPNTTSYLAQGLPELWNDRPQGGVIPQAGSSYVNLNQVQGFPDPQEVAFEADERYMDVDTKNEYTIEVDHRVMKTGGTQNHTSYRHFSDEGLGASIKDGSSPQANGTGHVDLDATTDLDTDADADAEAEDETTVAEPASDTEYSPKATRTRKRRAPRASSPPAVKRTRVTKPAQKTKNSLSCKQCNHAPFKDAVALQRHVNSTHTRAFICVFGFAGCNSTFASKNEWKRHVSSQHLNLSSWVCNLGACGKVQNQLKKDGVALIKGSEFNRKDLFTQHLRRMHAPFAVKRQNKKNPEWEERLKDLQVTCLRVKRLPPTHLACPLNDCDGFFEGATCWDDRMEHVGKHLEKAAISTGMDTFSVEQEDDDLLVGWGLRERIIEQKAGGGYKLCGAWFEKVDDQDADADADGDYE